MGQTTFDQPLSAEAMTRAMTAIMTGTMAPEAIGVFLTTLATRGETAEEIAAAAQVLRAHAVPLPLTRPTELCDTCGTGGDGQGTINVSTLAALVAAAAGVRVCKHGNRAASSRCGSADLLEALGVNLEASPEQVARAIEEEGFGFCFAQRFHPAMKAVAPIRKALGIRTIFNLIGPLANPAPLTFQVVGVADPRWLRPIAEALRRLGIRRGMVVHGRDGLDEVTTTTTTDVLELRDGRITEQTLEPTSLGVAPAAPATLRGGEAAHNARLAREVLGGKVSALSELVAANAGCALYVADRVGTIHDGVAEALAVLRSGRALELLERVRRVSRDAG